MNPGCSACMSCVVMRCPMCYLLVIPVIPLLRRSWDLEIRVVNKVAVVLFICNYHSN